jgi:glyoxylate reductase
MKKVFITRRLPSVAEEILKEKFDVYSSDRNEPYPRDKLKDIVSDYDAVLTTVSENFDKSILKKNGRLKVISNYATGLDNVDVAYARSVGITVYNTPDAVTNSTADLTLLILLSLTRKISLAQKFIKEDRWKAWDPELFLGEELNGKVFGILGFGKIGQAVAKRAAGFGMKIIYYNRSKKDGDLNSSLKQYTKSTDLDELLKTSDYLSIHLPLTDETKGFVNKDLFDRMQKKPIILNMARGDIVNTNDLVEALRVGKVRGAGLDVISPEPISGDHPLCHFDNCLVVPHIGTATLECRTEMARIAAKNICDHFESE